MASPFANDPSAVFGSPAVAPIDAAGAQRYASQSAKDMRDQVTERRRIEQEMQARRKEGIQQAVTSGMGTGANLANSALNRSAAATEGSLSRGMDAEIAAQQIAANDPNISSADRLAIAQSLARYNNANTALFSFGVGGQANQLAGQGGVRPAPQVGTGTINAGEATNIR